MRDLARRLLFVLVLLPVAACSAEQASAPADSFKPGDHYKVLPRAVEPTVSDDKVEVLEFFLYTCPHCYAFEPTVHAWSKAPPAGVSFKQVPAAFGAHTLPMSKAFYTAEALGVLDKLHPALFAAIHQHKLKLDSEQAIAAIFLQNGVSASDFKNTFNGFHVANLVKRSEQLTQAYKVTGVPSMAVAGKYWINPNMGRGYDGMINVVNALVAREQNK